MITEGMALGDYSRATRRREGSPAFPSLIIFGCVLFNFGLCFLNTAGLHISVATVVLCEVTLVFLSASYGFYGADKERYFWLIVLIAQFILVCVLSLLRDEFIFKSFRDVLIMPIFIVLGLASGKTEFSKPLLWLGSIIAAVALFEAFSMETFTRFFDIKGFFIAKGYSSSSFQYSDSGLFVSGIRPGGRFFPLPFATHRISSVFLEPVYLGF
jgi:putative polymerase